MKDIHGKAILDYYKGNEDEILMVNNSYGASEEMPVEIYFRDEIDFSTIEHLALIECEGRILDLGAGAGAHALVLNDRGMDVTALEYSQGCVDVMKMSGLNQVVHRDYRKHTEKYDTILALMNGIGLAGKLSGVEAFLKKCKKMLQPMGQILIDSSDVSYLYEDGTPRPKGYFGEVKFQYEYKGEKGDWFDWVYVDQTTLGEIVKKAGMKMEILTVDEDDQFLVRIT